LTCLTLLLIISLVFTLIAEIIRYVSDRHISKVFLSAKRWIIWTCIAYGLILLSLVALNAQSGESFFDGIIMWPVMLILTIMFTMLAVDSHKLSRLFAEKL
jgi:hypothetical protein